MDQKLDATCVVGNTLHIIDLPKQHLEDCKDHGLQNSDQSIQQLGPRTKATKEVWPQ